jgi:hypothetical protein
MNDFFLWNSRHGIYSDLYRVVYTPTYFDMVNNIVEQGVDLTGRAVNNVTGNINVYTPALQRFFSGISQGTVNLGQRTHEQVSAGFATIITPIYNTGTFTGYALSILYRGVVITTVTAATLVMLAASYQFLRLSAYTVRNIYIETLPLTSFICRGIKAGVVGCYDYSHCLITYVLKKSKNYFTTRRLEDATASKDTSFSFRGADGKEIPKISKPLDDFTGITNILKDIDQTDVFINLDFPEIPNKPHLGVDPIAKQGDVGEYKDIGYKKAPIGYYIVEAAGNGDCLFNSLAPLILQSPANLRDMIVKELQKNGALYKNFIAEVSLNDYIDTIRKSGTMGGEIELQILAKLFEPIGVFNNQEQKWSTEHPEARVNIIYNTGHYDTLVLLSNKPPSPKTTSPVKTDDKVVKDDLSAFDLPAEYTDIEIEDLNEKPDHDYNFKNGKWLPEFAGTDNEYIFDRTLFLKACEEQGANPHRECAALRIVNYAYVNANLQKRTSLIDYFGGARTPKLLSNAMVHVQRQVITNKDRQRLQLCRDRKLENTTPKNKTGENYRHQALGTFCEHRIEKCFCASNATVFFLNDVYQHEVMQTISGFMNKQTLIMILQVFPLNTIGGDIVIGATTPKQGSWYRLKNQQIVYSPNTENGDIERHYVHDDMLPELATQNEITRYGLTFEVLIRYNLHSCYSVVVRARKSNGLKTKKKNIVQPLFNPDTAVYRTGTSLTIDVVRQMFANNVIPVNATAPYEAEQYQKIQAERSKNIFVDKLDIVLRDNPKAHGHKCKDCKLFYVHVHNSKTKDAGQIDASHAQFKYDCPYDHCINFNHVGCNCTNKDHQAALATLMSRVKTTYGLLPTKAKELAVKTIAAIKTDDVDALEQSKTIDALEKVPMPNDNDALPIVTPTDVPLAHLDDMIKNGVVIPDDGKVYRYYNATTKIHEHYMYIGDKNHITRLDFLSSKFTGILHIVIEGTRTPVDTKFLNRVLNKVWSLDPEKFTPVITTLVGNQFPDHWDEGLIDAVRKIITNTIIRHKALDNQFLSSTQVKFLRDARDNELNEDISFLSSIFKHGLIKSVKMLVTKMDLTVGDIHMTNGRLNLTQLDQAKDFNHTL